MQKVAPGIESQASEQMAYQAAGVDTRKEDTALGPFLRRLRNTWVHRGHVQLEFGHFANIVKLQGISIAISTDGVGTKALIAQLLDKYDSIGIDCVAMNVDDVLCVGAEPQSMVDYIAVQQIDSRMLEDIGKGLEEGARQANVTIVGGEIAQLPEMIQGEEGAGFDLAGTCIGTLGERAAITGARVRPGDVIIGLRSSGVHSNGLTLARRVFGVTRDKPMIERRRILSRYYPELGTTLGEELLVPSRIYVTPILEMMRESVDIKGLVHITSDGFLNLSRLEADVGYVIDALPDDPPPIFRVIQSCGSVSDAEMYEVFNMGTGFCAIVPERDVHKAIEVACTHGSKASAIGYVVADRDRTVEITPRRLRGWSGKGFQRMP